MQLFLMFPVLAFISTKKQNIHISLHELFCSLHETDLDAYYPSFISPQSVLPSGGTDVLIPTTNVYINNSKCIRIKKDFCA